MGGDECKLLGTSRDEGKQAGHASWKGPASVSVGEDKLEGPSKAKWEGTSEHSTSGVGIPLQ